MNSLGLIFSFITIVSALIFLALIIVVHFFSNRFNPVKNTVSDYLANPDGKHYAIIKIATPLAGAISTLSLAIAIATDVETMPLFVVLFLVVASICRFILIFLPTDITGRAATKIGKLHLFFAVAAFASVAFAVSNFHITTSDKMIGQAVVFSVILLLIGFLPWSKKIFGLLERVFLFSSITWLVTIGLELLFKK